MGQGSNKAMGKSSIFSGSGSKQGLSKKLGAAFYGEQDMSYPGGVPGPGKVTDSAKKDYASYAYDSDQDGDSITNDYNQDGTMIGRGIKAAKKFLGGPGKVTDDKLKSQTGQQEKLDGLSPEAKKQIEEMRKKRADQAKANKTLQGSYIQASK
jgi:uncharacterized protein YjbJ (UPF0337 family)